MWQNTSDEDGGRRTRQVCDAAVEALNQATSVATAAYHTATVPVRLVTGGVDDGYASADVRLTA